MSPNASVLGLRTRARPRNGGPMTTCSSTRSGGGRKRRSSPIAVVPFVLLVSLAGGAGSVRAQEVTVELWTHEFEPLQTAMLDKWIPEFEEAFPDITVEMTTIPLAGAVTYD